MSQEQKEDNVPIIKPLHETVINRIAAGTKKHKKKEEYIYIYNRNNNFILPKYF
jgi:hypothetical protein